MATVVRVGDPGHGCSVEIPDETAPGRVVEVDRDERPDASRIHLQSWDGSALYLEIVAYRTALDHRAAAEQERSALRERAPDAHVSDVASGVVAGRPATIYAFDGELHGRRRVRRFALLDVAGRTFRIVADPQSAVTTAVLATIAFDATHPSPGAT